MKLYQSISQRHYAAWDRQSPDWRLLQEMRADKTYLPLTVKRLK